LTAATFDVSINFFRLASNSQFLSLRAQPQMTHMHINPPLPPPNKQTYTHTYTHKRTQERIHLLSNAHNNLKRSAVLKRFWCHANVVLKPKMHVNTYRRNGCTKRHWTILTICLRMALPSPSPNPDPSPLPRNR